MLAGYAPPPAPSRRRRRIKYFVLGAFSSAFFLYGIALVYGATGSTNLADIAGVPGRATSLDRQRACCSAGIALLLVGLGFKVAAVPFHSWTPDVYQGSPTPVTAFMASAVKAAGFAGLLRVFVVDLRRPTASTGSRSIYALAVAHAASSARSSPSSRPT